MELIFYPNNKLGNINFEFTEKEIIDLLGTPYERSIYDYSDSEYAIQLLYKNPWRHIWFDYENSLYKFMTIHVDDLILDNMKFSEKNKEELLNFIELYHNKLHIEFVNAYEKGKYEDFYDYPNLGLSIWFEDNEISDISVQKVFE